jgi:hypothetical protein
MRYRTTSPRLFLAMFIVLLAGVLLPASASAAPGPAWEVSSVAQPTNFSAENNGNCARLLFCDRYIVTLTNIGTKSSNGSPIVIADTVPQGLRPIRLTVVNFEEGEGESECPLIDTTCTYDGTVAAGGTLVVDLKMEVEAGSVSAVGVTNIVSVTGGGAPSVSTNSPLTTANTIEGLSSAFGFAAFGFAAREASGAIDAQAADHPTGVTSTVNLKTIAQRQPDGTSYRFASVEPPRDLAVYLPLGVIGDPIAATRCTQVQLLGNGSATDIECPPTSRVGTIVLFEENEVIGSLGPEKATAVYNMVPEDGYPAEFAFKVLGKAVPIYASLVHMASGYALRVGTPGVPTTINVEGFEVTFFGDPYTADNDSNSSQAFFTNPVDCSAGPLKTRAEADSWAAPGEWTSAESVAYPSIAGCNLLQFEPTIALHPEVTQAEAPSGYEINIKVPQTPNQFPILATPDLKNVTMTLPAGMTISPGAGDGLVGCEATGEHGIDMPTNLPEGRHRTPTEAGEGEEIGPDGMSHLVAGHCPPASQIGTMQIVTPLLEHPLEGRVYVAQPQCGGPGQPACTMADATDGHLYGLYLEAEGSGVVVKLAGSVSANPTTGQLTARFTENPQLPFSEVSLHLKGGGRAPLANPRQCGAASASADLAPWSAPVAPDATPVSPAFTVDWNGGGGQCPATLPFAPTLSAGSTNVAASRFTPFTLTLARGDRQQDISQLQVHMPLGLLGMLSQVPLCPEPQAALGTCSAASEVGTATAAAGTGSQPLWVSGHVYLTGPYGSGPFGLTAVVPAVAGPFNLGNVVVRSSISIDPHTAAVTITTAPLPRILDGIPLRIQKLNVTVSRTGFLFNPTNCAAKQVAASVEAVQGATANLTTPFAVEDCRSLPFTPTFKVSTQAKTSKTKGASLVVKVTSASGQANIAKVAVSLPKALPARLTTIQHACPAATFESNPATCDPRSLVGMAKAHTPVLSVPLTGPVYLVSHGGAAFPDLVVVLEGEGVRVDLTGSINIKGSITSSTFASVPDAPIGSFELTLPEGPHSALTATLPGKAKGSLCGTKLTMPTTLTGQNGAQVKQSTKISVSGCPKPKKKPAKAKKA